MLRASTSSDHRSFCLFVRLCPGMCIAGASRSIKMRRVLSFLVWLFSFWTWKEFFLRWLLSPANPSGETAENLPSQEGQPESELVRFLSSLPEDERWCDCLRFDGDSKVQIEFGSSEFTLFHGTGVEASYQEFLEAVASSEIIFCEEVRIFLEGDDSCKHMEAFADALCQFGHGFRKLHFWCRNGPAVRFAKCVSQVLLQNDVIEDLNLDFGFLKDVKMDRELAPKFMAIIVLLHNLRILKSFEMETCKLDAEGMEQLLKPFQGPSSILQNLKFDYLTSNAQLEHISGIFALSTSLKTLTIKRMSFGVNNKAFTRGYTSIGTVLCSNQSLEALTCRISRSLELKALLDPLMPKTNNLQRNTTLTKLKLWNSIGGKEGIEALVDMICTNSSLLELDLINMDDLSSHSIEGIENVLTILEALRPTNL